MKNILILAGDGIGPEVMREACRIIDWFGAHRGLEVNLEHDLVGGAAYDVHQCAISDATMEKALAADIVMLGAVGGAKWDNVDYA
ncbi:MAG: 3-isopropylmalate dehydrogenase, partial [Alphaproteobacteria bacterium]|nr:3-isopropylmalate dehydrogenase [Alphaproteobacteria bacterium]